jgi:hypothetical protein
MRTSRSGLSKAGAVDTALILSSVLAPSIVKGPIIRSSASEISTLGRFEVREGSALLEGRGSERLGRPLEHAANIGRIEQQCP